MTRSPVVSPATVGREEPRRRLLGCLERTVAGEGTVLLLGGPAGIGKSRLVRDLKAAASLRGARVVEGRCSEA